jgi:hypothetical protein
MSAMHAQDNSSRHHTNRLQFKLRLELEQRNAGNDRHWDYSIEPRDGTIFINKEEYEIWGKPDKDDDDDETIENWPGISLPLQFVIN